MLQVLPFPPPDPTRSAPSGQTRRRKRPHRRHRLRIAAMFRPDTLRMRYGH